MTDDTNIDLRVCGDCLNWVANADDSSLDLLPEDDAAQLRDDRNAGIQALSDLGYQLVPGDNDFGFSHYACELCKGLAGDRYEVIGLLVTPPA